jgi:hypothetical protein
MAKAPNLWSSTSQWMTLDSLICLARENIRYSEILWP